MKRKFSQRHAQQSNVRDLLTRGVAAAKAASLEEARFYLEWVLITDASEDQLQEAWLWLSEISTDPAEKQRYLEEILSRRPGHALARRKLAILHGRLRPDEIVDPEKLPVKTDAAGGPVQFRQFSCPRCASRMVFTPDGASLHCEHCGYRQLPDTGAAIEEADFIIAMATARGHLNPVATATFTCHSCTASFLLAPGVLTVTCPYCDHTYAVASQEIRDLAPPQAIIPFVVDEGAATQLIQRWLAQHRLRPHAAPHGIYLPAWTFDVGGNIEWRGQVSSYEESTRSWETVSGSHPLLENDLIVPACNTLPGELMPLLQSYDLDALLGFDEDYLAAWPAQTYEITVGDASLAARQRAYRRSQEDARRSYSSYRNLQFSSAGLAIISYKLILLPLWIAQYRHDERLQMLAVNAQSGRLLAQSVPATGLLDELRHWMDRLWGKR